MVLVSSPAEAEAEDRVGGPPVLGSWANQVNVVLGCLVLLTSTTMTLVVFRTHRFVLS